MIRKMRPHHPVSHPNLEGINEELQSGRVKEGGDRLVRGSGLCTSVPPSHDEAEGREGAARAGWMGKYPLPRHMRVWAPASHPYSTPALPLLLEETQRSLWFSSRRTLLRTPRTAPFPTLPHSRCLDGAGSQPPPVSGLGC